jgi:hypothetical protein
MVCLIIILILINICLKKIGIYDFNTNIIISIFTIALGLGYIIDYDWYKDPFE